MDILFLDFDGVVVDSAGENAVTAWRAGRSIWPDDWTDENPPAWMIEAFCALRPLLHVGYESFGLMRLAWLTGREKVAELMPTADRMRQAMRLLKDTGLDKDELVRLFGGTRDAWLKNDFTGWLEANRFYPGVVEGLRKRLAKAPESVYILTTKQERFVVALARQAGLELSPDMIFGLDRGVGKPQQLLQLLPAGAGRVMHFVEDRLPTLMKVIAEPGLANLHLHLAEWGYVTPEELRDLDGQSRINRLSRTEFVTRLLPA